MKVACIQHDVTWENKPENFAAVFALLHRSPPPHGALVLLPEMFATGFSMNVPAIADDSGQTQEFLEQSAAEFAIHLCGGVVTRSPDGRGLNQALAINPLGKEIARYTKIHPFTFAGETDHFSPGTKIITFPCGEFTVAPFICYDLRFPEIFRRAVRAGANLFTVIANWPAARESHWLTLLRARAIENQSYVAAVNRIGSDPNARYSGRSLIIDPRGEILVDAGETEQVISCDLDFESLTRYRRDFPALADMRPE